MRSRISDKSFLDHSTIDALVVINDLFLGQEDRKIVDGHSENLYDICPALDLITGKTPKHSLYETKTDVKVVR